VRMQVHRLLSCQRPQSLSQKNLLRKVAFFVCFHANVRLNLQLANLRYDFVILFQVIGSSTCPKQCLKNLIKGI
jgi:hypothetical protein